MITEWCRTSQHSRCDNPDCECPCHWPGSELSRLETVRAQFPEWQIERAPGRLIGYTATRGDDHIYSPHLTGLATKLADACKES